MIDFKLLSKKVRANALKMVHKAKASHIASALSIVDILTVLYGSVMKFDKEDKVIETAKNYLELSII